MSVSSDGAEVSNESDASPGWVRATWGVCPGQTETFSLQLSQGVSGKDRLFGVCGEGFADFDPDMTGMEGKLDPQAPFYRRCARELWFFQNKTACSDGVVAMPPEKFDFFKTGDIVELTLDRSGGRGTAAAASGSKAGMGAGVGAGAGAGSSLNAGVLASLSSPGFSVLTLRVNGIVKASIGNLPAAGVLYPAVFCYNSKQSFRVIDTIPPPAAALSATTLT